MRKPEAVLSLSFRQWRVVDRYVEDIAAMGEELEASSENLASNAQEQSASVEELKTLAEALRDTSRNLNIKLEKEENIEYS